MTKQEIFDKVATHLLTQRKPCLVGKTSDGCCYRKGKLKCAAGCLLPKGINPENQPWNDEPWDCVPQRIRDLAGVPKAADRLVEALQAVHDYPSNWALGRVSDELKRVAGRFRLQKTIVDKFPVL